MNVIIIVDNKPMEVSDDACKSEGKTYAERFGTPSHPNGCPVLIAVALEKAEAENTALRGLLQDSLGWLDDYGMRMSGTSNLVDRIETALRKETQP